MPTSLKNTWFGLPVPQRIALVAVLVVVFGGILFAATMAGRPSYGVLFSNLETEDAAAVTDKLREQKVPYRLENGGKTVQVPQDKVYDLRLSLASEGLPRGGTVGFELFDKTSFGATDFTQHLNLQRALQGELQRTVNKLEGVVESRVHLVLPQKRLFDQEAAPATASVVLHLRPGYQVPERQVAGLVHLVSSAVEGLKPENVSVHDAQGELLSGDRSAGSASMTSNQIQLQERFERRLEVELTRLAEQVVGPGKAAIRVSADLNWDQTETNTETFKGGGANGKGIPLEETLLNEAYQRADATAGGVAGVPSNLDEPGAAPTGGPTKPGQYQNSRTLNRYAVDRTVEKKVSAPGKLRRLSVAVLLDSSIPSAQQRSLKNAFAAAAGLDLLPGGRGDRIELLPMQFDRSADAAAAKSAAEAAKQAQMQAMVRNGAAIAIVLLILGATVVLGRRLRAPRHQEVPALAEAPSPRLNAVLDEPIRLDAPAAVEPEHPSAVPPEEPQLAFPPPPSGPSLLDLVRQFATERPDEVARQLEAWIAE